MTSPTHRLPSLSLNLCSLVVRGAGLIPAFVLPFALASAACSLPGSDAPPPPSTSPGAPVAAPPQLMSLALTDETIGDVVTALARATQLPAVIDPAASLHAQCARLSIVSARPVTADALVGLVRDALSPSGFTLTRQPNGLVLGHDGMTTPAGCLTAVDDMAADDLAADDAVGDDATPPTDPDSAIRRVSDTEYMISAAEVARLTANPDELLRSVRIVPHMEDGTVHGLSTYGIRRRSLAASLGIRNGDVLSSVNGRSLSDPSSAMESYAALRGVRRIELVLEREGRRRTHVYRVVDRLPPAARTP